jgi:DNA-binding protein HU-beta
LKAAPSGAVFYCCLLVVDYLTQCIVGLFNTPLRFLPTANPTRSRNRVQNVQRGKKVNKASAARALDAMIDAVTNTLKNNDSVTLVGFGTFTVGDRAARTGRDPRTKEAIKIKAAKVPKFKAGKALKDAVN